MNHVCPVESAGRLDNVFRRWLQDPQKILEGYISEGMTVLDFGCGPGFFTVDMAEMVGSSGRVIAVDLQEGMLEKAKTKLDKANLGSRVSLHKCDEDKIALSEKVDFALAFYAVHEVPDQDKFFNELHSILNPAAKVLMVEPPFHVSRFAFRKTIDLAEDLGFDSELGPKVLFSKSVILNRE